MNRTLQQAEKLIVQLSREMREGRGEGARADQLRDELDEPLRRLSSADRKLIQNMSADLYLLEGERIVEPLLPNERLEDVLQRLSMAFRVGDYQDALALLRKVPIGAGQFSEDALAYGIGRCWDQLGLLEAAAAFFDYAYLKARKSTYAVSALDALYRTGCFEELLGRLEAVEHEEHPPAILALRAASLLYQLTSIVPEDDRETMFRRVVALVERTAVDDQTLPSVRSAAFVAVGFSYQHLNHPDRALEAFNKAVECCRSDASLVARGLTRLDLGDRTGALADFGEAIALGTSLAWPYLYLAHAAVTDERWEEGLQTSLEAIGKAPARPMRARFFEWAAISAAQLGRDKRFVQELFELAEAMDPFDPVIQRNAATFAERRGRWEFLPLDPVEARQQLEVTVPGMLLAA